MEYSRHVFQQPFFGDVNVFRLGDTLLDTGHMAPDCRAPVAEALADGPLAGVERVVITHPDEDHIGGSQSLDALADLPHTVYEGANTVIRGFNAHLRAGRVEQCRRTAGVDVDNESIFQRYFPPDDYAEGDIPIERIVGDGDTVRLGGYDCEVIHTPGHEAHHMALWYAPSGTLFSADVLSQNGHFVWSPVYGDVGAYKHSLHRLEALDPDLVLPGHGPPMTDPAARIEDAIAKTERTERILREAVADAEGPITAGALARDTLGASDGSLRFLTLTITSYLDYLAEQGALTVDYRDDGVYASHAGG